VKYLVKNNKEQLHGLSNQFFEIFITDLFAKHKVKPEEAKLKISDEQREKLRGSVEQLKEQVEDFLQNNKKTKITEEKNKEQSLSPLREAVNSKKQAETDHEESE